MDLKQKIIGKILNFKAQNNFKAKILKEQLLTQSKLIPNNINKKIAKKYSRIILPLMYKMCRMKVTSRNTKS